MATSPSSPGEIIKAELEKRRWTQTDLATVLGKHQPNVNDVIQGKRSITPDMAVALGAAFGSDPEYWLGLDAKYRLSLLEPNTDVEKRARIFAMAPVKDMEKRHWIRPTHSLAELEKEVCRFFHIPSLDSVPKVHANARQSFKTEGLNSAQVAWCVRAAKLASLVEARPFTPSGFKDSFADIRKLADYPEKAKHLPKVLSSIGVRLVIVEPLPHSRIDGAAFWLADDAPVVVLSLRYDRVDCLWFTLFHELSHIKHRDAQSVDTDLVGDQKTEAHNAIEQRASNEAASALITKAAMDSFILRVKPFYSKHKIVQFAIRSQVHPGIVVGQLQHRGEIPWGANREMLAKVRDIATTTALTDGWGNIAPVL
jgi:HTH-type transcriptional regulator / antitoxin HigA